MGRKRGASIGKVVYLISLTGLPPTIRLEDVRNLFNDVQYIDYHIRSILFEKNEITSIEKVLIEVYSKSNADKLVTLLSSKTFISQFNISYSCKACIESKCEISNTENPSIKNFLNYKKTKETHDKLFPKSDKHPECKLLPKFKKSKRILMDEMESLVTKHCHKNKLLFMTILYAQIRMRLAEFCESRSFEEEHARSAFDYVKMYRDVYDKSTDESFVIETYELVQLACWPTEHTMKDGLYLEELELEDEGIMNTKTGKFRFT